MAVAVDYYSVLNINRDASADQIQEAVKRTMREWRKRTEAADLSVRQEAELRVKRIQEAREILGNAAKRSQYDQQLAREGVARAELPSGTAPEGTSWLDRAKGYLAVGDYHSAAYAAREATQNDGQTAEGWWVRSRANAGLDKFDDAFYEARQAVELETTNPEFHFHLGAVSEEMGKWNQALSEYQEAARLDPQTSMYQLAVGGVWAQNGQPDKALPIVEPIYKKNNDDQTAAYYLAMILVDMAERVPRRRDRDSYIVTSREEITQMRAYLARAEAVKHKTDDVRQSIRHVVTYLDDMERKRFQLPAGFLMLGGDGGCAGIVVMGIAVILPLALLLAGFGAFGSNAPGWGLILLLAAGGIGYLWFKMMWVPGWKINARNHG